MTSAWPGRSLSRPKVLRRDRVMVAARARARVVMLFGDCMICTTVAHCAFEELLSSPAPALADPDGAIELIDHLQDFLPEIDRQIWMCREECPHGGECRGAGLAAEKRTEPTAEEK